MTPPTDRTPSNTISFLLNGKPVHLAAPGPTRTVLQYLRNEAGLCGSKEGCAEGDCGACTVVLGELSPDGGKIGYRAINSCIRFLPTLDGKLLLTVEGLPDPGTGAAHPVQQAMVDCHGSQCGFCTPGFVMSLFDVYQACPGADREQLIEALAGNLCRCTGYRPILDAGHRMGELPEPSHLGRMAAQSEALRAALMDLREARSASARYPGFHAPQTVDELAQALEENPDALLLAGGTDIGLWVTQQMRDLPPLVHLGEVRALRSIRSDARGLWIGAAVTLDEAWPALLQTWPALQEQARRFASPPIRNSATLCGNLANGSPIGDSLPALLALDAVLELRRGAVTRRLPLAEFYLGYQRKALERGEFVVGVEVPHTAQGSRLASYKIAKRHDQDISAVCATFRVALDEEGCVREARLAYGGMAATARRAVAAESALTGRLWSQAAIDAARAALAQDFTPLSDLRASSQYRLRVAGNILQRFYLEGLPGNDAAPVRLPQHALAGNFRVSAGQALAHDSALLHVTGAAQYCDDIALPAATLHAAFGTSPVAHGLLRGMDLEPLRALPGVVATATATDVPGENNYGSPVHDDPLFATHELMYAGQPLFAVAATTHEQARRAARAARLSIEELPAVLDIRAALAEDSFVLPTEHVSRGRPREALAAAPLRLKGSVTIGGQDHFYLEGQIAVALPQDDGGLLIHSSTQHPTEVQHIVAGAMGLTSNRVVVQCRRMGGGFGGKESQPALLAAVAAVLARKTGRPVKLRLDRDADMIITGKRHDFIADFEVGFDTQGRIHGLALTLASRCGYSADLSGPVNDRAMFHIDNAYYLEHVEITSHRCRTHTVSNTAFRGFGGPQGMVVIEEIIDRIARHLGKDPLDVRRTNYYGIGTRDVTPYGQRIEDNVLHTITDQLEATSAYRARREAIDRWNTQSPVIKRGLALTPVKFGISFTSTAFNQAGALLQVYADGTVLLNHGGTEMGQGLHIKVLQVVAQELGVPLSVIRVTTTDTSKVPNTSATAASSGSDLNGMAARAAAREIRARLTQHASEKFGVAAEDVRFTDGEVFAGSQRLAFAELTRSAYFARTSLSATGYYRTPKIHWNKSAWNGRPFYYFSYGAAVAEVALDTLTGESRLMRVDILHDVGRSLNPAVDLGQIEGGFMQGAGWLTSEELVWNDKGELRTHAPSTYKIPTAYDWPAQAFVRLLEREPNREDTIYRSKAVGEPPLMLGIAVLHALRDACAACSSPGADLELPSPATPEVLLRVIDALRAGAEA